jgi:hypothetical protein
MSKRVIFIASLGHSGSTLLDLILGSHPEIIGLGEVGRSVAPKNEASDNQSQICSCGQAATECKFWGDVLTKLAHQTGATEQHRYEIALDSFSRRFGSEKILVDSSKYLQWLRHLSKVDGLDLRVIFLIRDVRSFAISAIDNAYRKRKAGMNYRSMGAFKAFRHWHHENLKTAKYLANANLPFMGVGYEELCLAPDHTIPKICQFLDIPFEQRMIELAHSSSHVIRGNRMRHDGNRRKLRYDPRWLVRNEWMLPALCYPRIMHFNSEQVYSNDFIEEWQR